jgi:hypothetical protein
MSTDHYIPLDEAERRCGLCQETLRRLLRHGVLDGYKAAFRGKSHWLVSVASLTRYTHPIYGFALDLPGPKLFLKRRSDRQEDS